MGPSLTLRSATTAVLLALPAALTAQDGFLFRPPLATLAVRIGMARPAATGELFDDMREWLTLSKGDFTAEAIAGEALFQVTPRVDLGVGFEWAQSAARSEFQDYLFPDDSPIEQTTKLRRAPLSMLVRFYPLSRGESLSSFAWVPRRLEPFVGGGGGLLWYRLEQSGYFVDHESFDIFKDEYVSSGHALAGHLLAGANYWVAPRVGITAEGRYSFAGATPEGDFDYGSIDLSGFQATAGISFRF